MPPTPVSVTQERMTRNRAASVPVSRRENSGLESLLLKKPSEHTVIHESSSGSPSVVVTRGRKRNSSSFITSRADYMDNSVSAVQTIADASEQHPKKKRKRSSSTSAAPGSTQLSTQLQSRRRSRSRISSPVTDVEYARSTRASARLARRMYPVLNSCASDIYAHLADPNDVGKLLSEPSAHSVVSSTSSEMVGSRSAKQPRGRRRKVVDLTDENAKKGLMEEWARMRQFQGTLPLSGIDENACLSQMLLCDTRKGDESISSIQLEAKARRGCPDADLVRSETTIINIPQSQEITLKVSPISSFSTQATPATALPTGSDAPGNNPNSKTSVLPSVDGTEQSIVPGIDVEVPSAFLKVHIRPTSSSDELVDVRPDSPWRSGSSSPTLSTSRIQEDSVHIPPMESTRLPVNEQAEAASLDDSHPVVFTQMHTIKSSSIHLDADEEFHMLDVPEIFTLPWVPVAPHLYVPPGLGKLISGMREQLMVEARARQRAEELYQAELNKRISAEKVMEDLQAKLEERAKDVPA